MRRRLLHLLLAGCLVAGGLAVAAGDAAAALSPVLKDCNANSALTEHYSIEQLQRALQTMPAEIKEYTPCYQIIENQLNKQLGKKGGTSAGSSSGGSFLSTPVLIVLIVIVLGGGGLAYLTYRRGSGGGGQSPPAAGT